MDSRCRDTLARSIAAVLADKPRCLMCIAGNSGSGKSTLGKDLRKTGIGNIRPREILVIDDGVASVPFLGLFRRKVKFRTKEKDYLKPFEPYFKGKKLVVYVSVQPARRLDECDILLEVDCAEERRLQHLQQRNADGDKRFSDTAGYRLVKPGVRMEFRIRNDGRTFSLEAAAEK